MAQRNTSTKAGEFIVDNGNGLKSDEELILNALAKYKLQDQDFTVNATSSTLVADPGPLGLFAFAFTTVMLQGYHTGLNTGVTPLIWCYALAYGGLVLLLAGMWEFVRRNTFAATVFSSFGAFWIGYAVLGFLVANNLVAPDAASLQMLLSLWGCVAFFLLIPTMVLNVALQILFLSLAVMFWLLAAGATRPNVDKGAGWVGLFVAAVAFYIGLAQLCNEIFGVYMLPVGICHKDRPNLFFIPLPIHKLAKLWEGNAKKFAPAIKSPIFESPNSGGNFQAAEDV